MYTFWTYLLLPFAIIKLACRGRKNPEYLKNIPERLGYYKAVSKNFSATVWIHAVSVGEVFTCQSLVKVIHNKHPHKNILITTTTPTGRQVANRIFPNQSIEIVYLPFDVPFAIKKFIRFFNPRVGILMETEIWPNLIKLCNKNQISLSLVNARLSKKSARRYAKFPKISRRMIDQLILVAAQTRQDAKRFRVFRSKTIHVTGSMKFDRETPESHVKLGIQLKKKCETLRPIFLAASTRPGEEALILETVVALRSIGDILTIIAPRHPERCEKIDRLLQERLIKTQKASSATKIDKITEVLLGDELGNLVSYYHACDVTFVGGSLLPYGGQNFMEACATGKPVIIGPHTFNFQEFAKEAVNQRAVLRVLNGSELTRTATLLLTDSVTQQQIGTAGLKFFQSKQGATKKTYNLLRSSLSAED